MIVTEGVRPGKAKTTVYLTIDTEYASSLPGARGPGMRADNFSRSILCDTPSGPVGIIHQMDVMDRCGQKGVFFVDPMPALLWGVGAIEDVVGPIISRGHDVQLHCHTEWLARVANSALHHRLAGGATGRNIGDFPFETQCRILDWAYATLCAAGAPPPIAFRAGNYGANDDTLRALAEIGISYDTSHSPALAGKGDCTISLGPDVRQPLAHHGVIEVPIACIEDFGGGLRHGQITALALPELMAIVRNAQDHDIASVTFVSHSFELASRDRTRRNRMVANRFEKLCEQLAATPGCTSATYAERAPLEARTAEAPVAEFDPVTGGTRLIEQAVSNVLYASSIPLRTKQVATATMGMLL